jgi:hypothetical protein
MPTQAIAATGIVLNMAGTPVPEVTNLSEVGAQFNVVDVSAHDGGNWASKIPTLLDGGTIRVSANFVPANAQHVALRTAMINRVSTAFTVRFPNVGATTWSFNAFVTRYRIPSAPVNGALPLEFELTVDGAITFA